MHLLHAFFLIWASMFIWRVVIFTLVYREKSGDLHLEILCLEGVIRLVLARGFDLEKSFREKAHGLVSCSSNVTF